MVTTFYPPFNFGGDGIFVLQLASDLVAAVHEVQVVHCLDAYRSAGGRVPAETPETERVDGVAIHRLSHRVGLLSAVATQQTGVPLFKQGALKEILSQGFDVINFHNISLVGGPGVLSMGEGVKIFTLHEHWWVCPTHVLWKYTGELCVQPSCLRCTLSQRTPPQAWRLSPGWMGRCLRNVDLVLAHSRFTADRHEQWMARNQVQVPLDILPGYAPAPVQGKLPDGLPERFMLYVGRLTAAKGVLDVADAFRRLPDIPLVIVGTGELEETLRCRGQANIHLAGWVSRSDLGAIYAAATALVFPSRCAETFGLTAAEALSHGTPVVARPAGGVADVVSEDVGVIYNSERELIAAVRTLWHDPKLRHRLSENAAQRYEQLYTPQAYLQGYLERVERLRRR
jgi:glycosyltransferase involved in cell wall biosynthesis